MSTARRRSGPNEFGIDEQGFTRALPEGSRSGVQGHRAERDDAVPLFISDPHGRPRPEEYAAHYENDRGPLKSRSAIPRLIAACLVIVAVGGGAAAYRAQIAGSVQDAVSGDASAAPAVGAATPSPLSAQDSRVVPASRLGKDPGKDEAAPLGPIVRPPADVAPPSRDAMKAAYQNALQGQPLAAPPQAPGSEVQSAQVNAPQQVAAASPFSTPAAAPQPVTEPVHRLAPDQIAALIRRGDDLVASGDVAAARLALRRAAESGDARAMLKLGATYDPALLSHIQNHGVAPDLASARGWYEKAAALGEPEARRRLEAFAR